MYVTLCGVIGNANIMLHACVTSVFGGKKQVSMFEMTKLVNKHLK